MNQNSIRYDAGADGIHSLVFNRPDRLNAINIELLEEATAALECIAGDPTARVLVISGAGRGFCAGADVGMMDEVLDKDSQGQTTWGADEIRQKLRLRFHRLMRALLRVPVPTIASVRGVAVGGGLDVCCACDMAIAADNSRFMVAYTRRGLFPDLGGYWLLPRIVGYRCAAEMVFTGRFVEAEEAEKIGLVNRVVADEELASATRELAEQVASGPPIALRLGKLLMQRTDAMDFETALEMGAMGTTITETSEDFREAVTAFLDKRGPVFRGR